MILNYSDILSSLKDPLFDIKPISKPHKDTPIPSVCVLTKATLKMPRRQLQNAKGMNFVAKSDKDAFCWISWCSPVVVIARFLGYSVVLPLLLLAAPYSLVNARACAKDVPQGWGFVLSLRNLCSCRIVPSAPGPGLARLINFSQLTQLCSGRK